MKTEEFICFSAEFLQKTGFSRRKQCFVGIKVPIADMGQRRPALWFCVGRNQCGRVFRTASATETSCTIRLLLILSQSCRPFLDCTSTTEIPRSSSISGRISQPPPEITQRQVADSGGVSGAQGVVDQFRQSLLLLFNGIQGTSKKLWALAQNLAFRGALSILLIIQATVLFAHRARKELIFR